MPMTSAFARTLRAFAEREQLDLTQTQLSGARELLQKKRPAPVGSPLTTGASKRKKQDTPAEEPAKPVQAAPAQEPAAQPLNSGLLTRGWAWLRKNNKFGATRQLRVAETVSLGEKRFVSVIHVDGQKFLIGGGASGVALLTQLGAAEAVQTSTSGVEQRK